MLKLAAPMIVTYVSFTAMQFVDRFMVSSLGTAALAAILPVGIISFVPASFALGMITSVNTFVSQSLGRGNKEDCSNYCWQAIYMGLAYFSVLMTIMWLAAPRVFKMLWHEPAVANLEVIYLRIMLYCHVLAIFIWSSSQFFMGVHQPVIKMYAAVSGHLTNIVVNYILIFGKLGLIDDEISAYEKALEIKPDMVAALANLGNAYFSKKGYGAAIELYSRAIQLTPADGAIYHNLGAAYSNKGQYEEAADAYLKASELSPRMANAHNGLSFVFYKLKEYQLAAKHMRIAEQLGSEIPEDLRRAIEEKPR